MTDPDEPLSIAAAARTFQVSRATLDKLRRSGKLGEVGAYYDDAAGAWRIPPQGLAMLGYRLRERPSEQGDTPAPRAGVSGPRPAVSGPEHPASTPATPAHPEQGWAGASTPDPDEVRDLRERLAHAERRAAVAEAIADERARSLADLRTTLRLLEARGEAVPSADATPRPEPAPSAKYKPGDDTGDGPAARPARRWLDRILRR